MAMPQAAQQRSLPFRLSTRKNRSPIAAQAITNWGQFVTFQLPQVGFGSRLILYCTGSVTTTGGTVSVAPVAYPPNPFSLIQKLRLYTTDQGTLHEYSGWGLYANVQRLRKRFNNNALDLDQYLNPTNRAALYTPLGTISTATTTPFSFWLEIMLGTDELMQRGLIPLQNTAVRTSLDVTLANLTDVLTVTSGTVSAVVLNINPILEWFSVPNDPNSYPSQKWVHTFREQFQPIQQNGPQYYRPLPGPVYSKIAGIVEANSIQATEPNLGQLSFQYASSVSRFVESYDQHIANLKSDFGSTPLDGQFCYEFSDGSGIPGIWDVRDLFNSANQSEVLITVNTTGLTISGVSQLRVMEERLTLRQ